MIVGCSRRPDGWIPVTGNEEEITDFLWGQDYYTKCSVKETKKGFDFWMDTEFFGEKYFNNREDYFVKLNDDGSITSITRHNHTILVTIPRSKKTEFLSKEREFKRLLSKIPLNMYSNPTKKESNIFITY